MINKETMNPKTTARIVGVLFLVATATYMVGSGLLDSFLSAPDFLAQIFENQATFIAGVLLEFVDAAAVVAIGVLLFPVLARRDQATALGYTATRIVEGILILLSGIGLLSLVALSQETVQAGAMQASQLQTLGLSIIAQSGLTFQVAMLALALGSLPFTVLLYRTRLVPRPLAIAGFVGYAALLASALLEIFGISTGMVLYLPGALFELAFPVWLIIKGFSAPSVASRPAQTGTTERHMQVGQEA